MVVNYTNDQKEAIKRNTMNRESAKNIRAITTWKYRDYQAAERSLAAASTPKQTADAKKWFDNAKDLYEEALNKFKLYKEIYPDIVQ
jgi:hypothetical protein